MTFKQCQGHQTYNENVDPEQGYTHAKFEKSCINSVQEKSSVTFFFQTMKSSLISAKIKSKTYIYDLGNQLR